MGQFRRTFLLKQFVPARCVAAAIGDEGRTGSKEFRSNSDIFLKRTECKMTTSAQIRRNQQNAKHSTGPRTIQGKNRSRFNAVKHACTAKLVLLPAEKPAEFNKRTKAFFEHFMPQNPYEVVLAEEAVYCSWQLQRCREAGVVADASAGR